MRAVSIFILLFFTMILLPKSGNLIVEIDNIEGKDGVLRVVIFSNEDGFPMEYGKGVLNRAVKIENLPVVVRFDSLNYGDYGVSVVHDSNNNRRMDTNWVGMPKEGFGVSNNVRSKFRAPYFEEAKFKVEKDSTKLLIEMIYL